MVSYGKQGLSSERGLLGDILTADGRFATEEDGLGFGRFLLGWRHCGCVVEGAQKNDRTSLLERMLPQKTPLANAGCLPPGVEDLSDGVVSTCLAIRCAKDK